METTYAVSTGDKKTLFSELSEAILYADQATIGTTPCQAIILKFTCPENKKLAYEEYFGEFGYYDDDEFIGIKKTDSSLVDSWKLTKTDTGYIDEAGEEYESEEQARKENTCANYVSF